ncbi:Bifunctional inhibitor/lipid-transfer protein/seed storage 2S albumin superfamily protein [Striga hermonthica]|uniref:Bifunctional inhibitor/lipid-transfer protein/seed storage 2S albumin superfamily protein n=1 Tax=Striga hermonthica TaxID=68872 RepID=A0A9N7MVR4_STRHE|nr:Bifunctional inhibitor/lipid-transfer protein/seed storage 2S albumin superfamily protein [Striga hermonthica]
MIITSFRPCLNYFTGSSGTGSSPTEDCCNSLRSFMVNNMDCVCLVVTGNVPVSIPFINANIAISLPRVCQNSVPLQCRATGVPLPPPGPVLFGPTSAPSPAGPILFGPPSARNSVGALAPAPHSHHSQNASKAIAVLAAPQPAESLEISPAAPQNPQLGPAAKPGVKPVVNVNSALIVPKMRSLVLTNVVLALVTSYKFDFN